MKLSGIGPTLTIPIATRDGATSARAQVVVLRPGQSHTVA